MPFRKDESCQGSVTFVEHSKGCKIATRNVGQMTGKYDSPKRGVNGIREVNQLTERCDSYEGGVRTCGKV